MHLRSRMMALLGLTLAAAGCERAHRVPELPAPAQEARAPREKTAELPPVLPHYGWRAPEPRLDIPIRFVAESSPAWSKLPATWNEVPGPVGLRVLAFGATPLEAAITTRALVHDEAIVIKVPRGLPDPTPMIPAVNAPTYGKWLLGRKIFFDSSLLPVSTKVTRSCADCHAPSHGFSIEAARPESGKCNVPSLVNAVYGKHFFWDGRAGSLEETLYRSLEDERAQVVDPPDPKSPGFRHSWPGLVKRIGGKLDYLHAFQLVYGRDPTADLIAKSLATYMRTILSGDSLYDRAVDAQAARKGQTLDAADFKAALTPLALDALVGKAKLTTEDAAAALARGYALFHGKARCATCHPGPLFTDHGFHNIGIGDSDMPARPGSEQGRFAHAPFGLKDQRLIGAYKTPTLRNLLTSSPYMHDGSKVSLRDVIAYFNDGITMDTNASLAPELGGDWPKGQRLGLSSEEIDALELFLRSLQGTPPPAVLTPRP